MVLPPAGYKNFC